MLTSIGSVKAAFRLLEVLFPVKPLETLTPKSLIALTDRYRWRDRRGNLVMIVAFLAIGSLYYGLIIMLMGVFRRTLPVDSRHVLGSGTADYVGCAAALSFLSSTFFVLLASKLILGSQEFAIYMAYGARRMGLRLDFSKVYQWLFLLIFPPVVVWAICYLTTYTAFTDNALIESPFGSFGVPKRTLPYTNIRGIYLVRKFHARFEDATMPAFVIDFKDGSRWKNKPATPVIFKKQLPVIRFVSRRCGAPLSEVEFIENVPR